jgi:hypothetical protein
MVVSYCGPVTKRDRRDRHAFRPEYSPQALPAAHHCRTRSVLQPADLGGAERYVSFHYSIRGFESVVLGHSLGREDKIDMALENDKSLT